MTSSAAPKVRIRDLLMLDMTRSRGVDYIDLFSRHVEVLMEQCI